jgi:Flp pilus assembly protein TadD
MAPSTHALPKSEARVDLSAVRASYLAERPTDEQEINLHLDLARGLESQGQLEKAQVEYRQAVARVTPTTGRKSSPPVAARLHRRLGAAYERLGQIKPAREHYQTAKKLSPRDPMVWNDAGYGAYLRGDWTAAEADLRKAAALDPTNPTILNNLGLTLAARGQSEEALRFLERASGPAAAHMNLGYALAATGKTNEAREQFEQVVRLDPSQTRARQALDQLSRTAPNDPVVQQAGAEVSHDDSPANPTSQKPPKRRRFWSNPRASE